MRVLLLPLLFLAISGCSRITVTSEPEGAVVLWSPDGVNDWRPWPPRAWGSEADPAPVTPMSARGQWSDTVWIMVRKEGFYAPLPRTAQLYPLHHEKLRFELDETPEAFAERMRSEGLAYYSGEWVDPEEAGLVQYDGVWITPAEALAARQTDRGLVEYGGEWITPEERNSRFAEDQRAKGLELFKDRWVSPEVLANEKLIDAEVAIIADSKYRSLEPPQVSGKADISDARIQLVNASGNAASFLFSGPQSKRIELEPHEKSAAIYLPPGRYKMAVVPVASGDGVPLFIEHPVAAGYDYTLTFSK